MRLIIVIALVFLGFFLIGLVHRAFADTVQFVDKEFNAVKGGTPIDWCFSNITGCGTGVADAFCADQDLCGISVSYTFVNDSPPAIRYDDDSICTESYCDHFGTITCSCCDLSTASDLCGSPSNLVWDDKDSCQYHCKCPDYNGELPYDFDTCSSPCSGLSTCQEQAECACENKGGVKEGSIDETSGCAYECNDSDPCDGVSPSPVEQCGGYENIVWGDDYPDTCDFTCAEPCQDSDGDGVYDPCDDCPDNASVTRDQINHFNGSAACEDIVPIGDSCGYISISCSDGSTTIHPIASLSVQQFQDCCTSDNTTEGQCQVTDDCKKDSDGDGDPDYTDPDDDNDGTDDVDDNDDDGDGIPDDQDNDSKPDSDGDGRPDDEDPDADGDGVPDLDLPGVDTSGFSIPDVDLLPLRYTDRFKEFIDNMKKTSLFSIPDKLSGSGLSGGTPVLTIDGGSTYGTQQINFGDWSAGLLVFRSVIYITSLFVAVRIITLKR
ncbi:MAG: hypothetical protein SD837_22055 [Candidatus Electrothrix scaldis]|nr:MAG: hypothetical protein SD837_22055 [Candidatus Electrothrix sp. GW3-3]